MNEGISGPRDTVRERKEPSDSLEDGGMGRLLGREERSRLR